MKHTELQKALDGARKYPVLGEAAIERTAYMLAKRSAGQGYSTLLILKERRNLSQTPYAGGRPVRYELRGLGRPGTLRFSDLRDVTAYVLDIFPLTRVY